MFTAIPPLNRMNSYSNNYGQFEAEFAMIVMIKEIEPNYQVIYAYHERCPYQVTQETFLQPTKIE